MLPPSRIKGLAKRVAPTREKSTDIMGHFPNRLLWVNSFCKSAYRVGIEWIKISSLPPEMFVTVSKKHKCLVVPRLAHRTL
jgi:hypothetical protein